MPSDAAIAAIDCGTNSTRLLVADAAGRPLERLMRITRLGQGVDSTGRLAPEAIERCVAVLAEYRQVMDRLGVGRGRLAAGLDAELLTGLDEGRLSLAGAVADLDPSEGPFLVLDIGGGSTELVAGDGPHDPELAAVSLQLGCVRVSERFLATDPPTAGELAAARTEVVAQLDRAVAEHPRFTASHRLVGLAGTVTTLVSLHKGMAEYDRDLVHHAVLTAADVKRWYEVLAADTVADRLGRPGMVPGRQDVIVGGALILDAVMDRLGFAECLVSEADILDGLVASQVVG